MIPVSLHNVSFVLIGSHVFCFVSVSVSAVAYSLKLVFCYHFSSQIHSVIDPLISFCTFNPYVVIVDYYIVQL